MDKLRRSLHTFLEIEVFAVESLVVAVSAGLGTYEQQLRLLLLAHVFVTCQSSNVQPRDVLYTQYIDMSSTVQHSVITCSHKRKLHPPLKGSPRTQDWSEPSVRTEPSMCRCGKCKQEGKKRERYVRSCCKCYLPTPYYLLVSKRRFFLPYNWRRLHEDTGLGEIRAEEFCMETDRQNIPTISIDV